MMIMHPSKQFRSGAILYGSTSHVSCEIQLIPVNDSFAGRTTAKLTCISPKGRKKNCCYFFLKTKNSSSFYKKNL